MFVQKERYLRIVFIPPKDKFILMWVHPQTLIKQLPSYLLMVEAALQTAQSYIYTISVSIVILLVGFAIGMLTKKFLTRVLSQVELNKIVRKLGITANIERGLAITTSAIIYLVTIVFFLNQLNITSIVLYLIVGGVLTLLILTFLVGVKDLIPNLVAYLFLQRKDSIKEGHHVQIREIEGIVERIGYQETEIRTPRGDILYVPNSLFIKSKKTVKAKR